MLTIDQRVRTAFWYDNSGNSRVIGPYQPVIFAGASDVTAANAAGVKGTTGDIVVVPALTSAMNTDRIAGITLGPSDPVTGEVTIVVGGIAEVMVSAAIAWDQSDAPLFCGLVETRTSIQTPWTNLYEGLQSMDPRVTYTYQMALAARTAIVPATGAGTNAIYYPIGYALGAATAKYDVIRVELALSAIYA